MDTFDDNGFNQVPGENEHAPSEPESQPLSQPQPEQGAYHGTGAGRRESPYASSPYVTNSQPQGGSGYQYQPQTQPPEKPKKKRRQHPAWKRAVSVLAVVALVIAGCACTAYLVNASWKDRTEAIVEDLNSQIADLHQQLDSLPAGSAQQAALSGDALTPAQLYNSCVDSVVAISSTVADSYFQGTEGTSTGSGFILTADGYIITNYHVVENASSVEVTTHDAAVYPAQVVGYDASNDIAVLKVEAEGLSAAAIGSSGSLAIGDMVAAIGNPLGELTATQTIGYVSGINREVSTDNTIISMIQTDAAINPGNSGGPLFNMQGQVVGITTAKYSGTTGSGASIEGIGFAIPIDDVTGIISDLIDYGYITGAYLGVTVQNNDAEAAAKYGLPTEGAYVLTVEEGAAAHRAGIQPKDLIVKLDTYEVGSVTDLTRALRNFKAGDTTTITVVRSGQELTLDITLDEKPRDLNASESDPSMPSEGDYEDWYEFFRRYFGD